MQSTILGDEEASRAGNGKHQARSGSRGFRSNINLPTRLFIIDGVISLPVAISGFFILPDVPEISSPWYLSQEVILSIHVNLWSILTSRVEQEVKLAQKRMKLEGRKDREPFTKSKLKKIFTSWHIYLLTILYM
jgi:hypothetical protein